MGSKGLGLWLAVLVGALRVLCVHAAYPEKPVRIIMPNPGGAGEFVLRTVQPGLEKRLGKPVVIEYRPGAAGNIAGEAVVKAAADGYTLLFAATNVFVINQFLYLNMGYDPLQALEPVAMLADTPFVVFVNGSLPVTTFAEFANYARAQNGKLNYGSNGNATTTHLSAFMLADAIGARMQHIPYKGTQRGVLALLSNEIQMYIISYGANGAFISSGKLKALAVAAPERLKVLPNVPTSARLGIAPGVIPGNWWGMAATAGSPATSIQRVSQDLRTVLGDPEIQKKYQEQGMVPVGNSPAEFGRRMAIEAGQWKAIMERTGVKASD